MEPWLKPGHSDRFSAKHDATFRRSPQLAQTSRYAKFTFLELFSQWVCVFADTMSSLVHRYPNRTPKPLFPFSFLVLFCLGGPLPIRFSPWLRLDTYAPLCSHHNWFTLNRDPYIIHLNIALYMVVSLYFGGKSNMFQMGKMYLLRSPAKPPDHFETAKWIPREPRGHEMDGHQAQVQGLDLRIRRMDVSCGWLRNSHFAPS